MGDKSPKAKQRGENQKSAGQKKNAAAAKAKQDKQAQQPAAKGKK